MYFLSPYPYLTQYSKYQNALNYCEKASRKTYEELKYMLPRLTEHLNNYNNSTQMVQNGKGSHGHKHKHR